MLEQIDWKQALKAIAFATLLSYPGLATYGQEAIPTAAAKQDRDRKEAQGFPTRRVGGGTRCGSANDCPGTDVLIALMPEKLVETAAPLPTIYFYIPPLKNPQNVRVEFVLRDGNDRLAYETTFTASEKGGIFPFKIPASATLPELALGQNYHWYLSIIYDASDRARDDVVEGWVRRVPAAPELARQLESSTPVEKVQLYQQAGLWYEAFAIAAALNLSLPGDANAVQTWQQLLESVGLAQNSALTPANLH